MLKVGFIGAGIRAQAAHYPCVGRLDGVSIEAVAELDEWRMRTVVEQYHIPRSFTDYRKMLDSVELDIVYVIMRDTMVTPPALDCLNAGKHLFIEKPPGASSAETQQLLDAAVENTVFCMVGYQRRYAAVTQEAMQLVKESGSVTLAVGEFHKDLLNASPEPTTTLWSDICHVVDLVRYMVGSEVVKVTAYQDNYKSARRKNNYQGKNSYSGIIRFANNAVGVVLGNRASGGRVLRAELHGVGIGCYMRLPEEIEIYEDNSGPRLLSGAEIAGTDAQDVHSYEGALTMHQHFIDCVRNGITPSSDVRDVIHTSRLVDQMEGIRH